MMLPEQETLYKHIGCRVVLLHTQAWKEGKPPMDQVRPQYKRELPAEEIPPAATAPPLSICQMSEKKLVLPRDVRQQFLASPAWGAEWRTILQKFDRDWGVAAETQNHVPAQSVGGNAGAASSDSGSGVVSMPNEPNDIQKLKEKYGDPVVEIPLPDHPAVLVLVTGPALFIMAKEATKIDPADGAIILHGAGTWLTGEKATKYVENNPGKAIPCHFQSDADTVILEDHPAPSQS